MHIRKGKISARPRSTGRSPAPTPVRPIENVIDDLAIFQELRATFIPQLRQAIEAGKSTEDILKMGRAAAVARLVSMAVLEDDTGKALSAIKELLERLEGKVTEKKEVTHAMARLKDEEIDALLVTAAIDEAE